jgi:nitrite reductase/ring-hydroxylating ferredoxin subunit
VSTRWHPIGRESDFAPDAPHAATAAGHRLCVGRTEAGWFAVEDRCPHAGGSMSEGMLDGRELICPLHAWAFDVETGASLDETGLVLTLHDVRVVGGVVEVRIDDAASTR